MPKIEIKSPSEIKLAAESGQILSRILNQVLKKIKPGLSTLQINDWIDEAIIKAGAKPSFKMVPGYRWASCVGLNDEVVHSIPKANKKIEKNDLLKIDAGVFWQGFHSDASWTIKVGAGKTNDPFLQAGKEALKRAIKACRPGNRVADISLTIEQTIKQAGFNPVKVLTGHGIGRHLHEEPMIPGIFLGSREKTPQLLTGMILAVEIIYNQGKPDVVVENDGWTISTKDGKISGLFEETVAVCEDGPLTLTEVRE